MSAARMVRGIPERGASCACKLEGRALTRALHGGLCTRIEFRHDRDSSHHRTGVDRARPPEREAHFAGTLKWTARPTAGSSLTEWPATIRRRARTVQGCPPRNGALAMTDDLEACRERARAHEEELREAAHDGWATPKELAARWKVSVTTVKDTPADELPYKEFGQGLKLKRRRYRWSDVYAFEARGIRGLPEHSADAA